jgi:hypothetical protein
MITIILIIILLVFLYKHTFENFEIVAYNNTIVSENKIDSIYDIESNTLQSLFDNLNLKNKDFKESNLDKQFKLVNSNLKFPFSNIFKKLIIEYIHDSIPKYKKDKVYILGKVNNIYQKDEVLSRTFIFNFTLVNPVNFFTRNIKIRLNINNINVFLDDTFNYFDAIDENLVRLNTNLESITLDKNDYINFTFNPIDKLYEPYYLIKNKYYLLDPFLTSGRESIITNNDKIKFQSILNDKKKSLSSEYDSYSNNFTSINL